MMPPSSDGKSSSTRYSNIYRAVRQACFEQPSEKTFLEPWIHAYSRKFPPTPARSSSFSPSSRGFASSTPLRRRNSEVTRWWPGDSKTLLGFVEQETIELCL